MSTDQAAGAAKQCPKCDAVLGPNDVMFKKPHCMTCGLIWTQLDRTLIAVVDMETSHLTNTIEMLRRNAEPHLERNGFEPGDTKRIYPVIVYLERELDRRLQRQRGLETIGSE